MDNGDLDTAQFDEGIFIGYRTSAPPLGPERKRRFAVRRTERLSNTGTNRRMRRQPRRESNR